MREIEFSDYKVMYKNRYYMCEKMKCYDRVENDVYDVGCQRWVCSDCRPKNKAKLFAEIVNAISKYDIDKHFILTCPGEEYRKNNSWQDSYVDMAKKWNQLRTYLRYHYPDFTYICLPRSQKNGYCHYHVLTNQYMKWNWINDARKKYGIGYVSIQKNKDVAKYLKNEYWKDHEWVIPERCRHYMCSRNIKLYQDKNSFNIHLFKNVDDIKDLQKLIYAYYGIYWDYDNYLTRYFENLKKKKII